MNALISLLLLLSLLTDKNITRTDLYLTSYNTRELVIFALGAHYFKNLKGRGKQMHVLKWFTNIVLMSISLYIETPDIPKNNLLSYTRIGFHILHIITFIHLVGFNSMLSGQLISGFIVTFGFWFGVWHDWPYHIDIIKLIFEKNTSTWRRQSLCVRMAVSAAISTCSNLQKNVFDKN